jgi:hypothetical protein
MSLTKASYSLINGAPLNVLDFGAVGDGVADDSAAIQAALDVASISNAASSVFMPQGVYNLGTTTITIPADVTLYGAGRNSTFVNYSGTGIIFSSTGVGGWTLRDFRIGYGSSATIVGLSITATVSTPVQWIKCANLQFIGGGAGIAGQKGIVANATGGSYIQNSWFEDIAFFYVDKPIERTNTETCTWRGIEISQFGFTVGGIAINGVSNDDVMQAHIGLGPGLGGGSNIAYKQDGNYNVDTIVSDIQAGGNTSLAFNGIYNTLFLSRPGLLTPLGTIDSRNNLLDSGSGLVNFGVIAGNVTSKTLTDYEEGTWTPTPVSGTGTVTTFGTCSGKYVKVGNQITLYGLISITTNGTGATSINFGGIPYLNSAAFQSCVGAGRESAVSGKMLQVVGSSTSVFGIFNYDNTYPGGNGTALYFTVSYQTA